MEKQNIDEQILKPLLKDFYLDAFNDGIKEGRTQAISKFKEKLKKELCTDKNTICRVNLCKTQGSKDSWICRNCEVIEKTAQEMKA